jgi:hypothetical protein
MHASSTTMTGRTLARAADALGTATLFAAILTSTAGRAAHTAMIIPDAPRGDVGSSTLG